MKILKFVRMNPGESQSLLSWILQGDNLNGLDQQSGNLGNLNLLTSQVQENIEILDLNINDTKQSIIDFEDKLKTISELLNQSSNLDLIEQVNINNKDIENIKFELSDLETNTSLLKALLNTINKTLGEWTSHKTVSEDIAYILSIIGSPANTDLHGNSDPSVVEARGFFKKIQDLGLEINKNNNAIIEINDLLNGFNINQLVQSIDEINKILGDNTKIDKSVIEEILLINSSLSQALSQIANLQNSIGTLNVVNEIEYIKQTLKSLTEKIDSSINDVSTLKGSQVNSELRITSSENSIINLIDDSKIIKQNINSIIEKIGADTLPSSISKSIVELTEDLKSQNTELQDIQVTLSEFPNLQNSVIALTSKISDVETKLYKLYNYYNKNLSIISDNNYPDLSNLANKVLIKLSYQMISTAGIIKINENLDLTKIKSSDVILVNLGIFDSLNQTPIEEFSSNLEQLIKNISNSSAELIITSGILVNANILNSIETICDEYNINFINLKLGINKVNKDRFIDSQNRLNTLGTTKFIDQLSKFLK